MVKTIFLLFGLILALPAMELQAAPAATRVKVEALVEGFDLDQAMGRVMGSETSHLNSLPSMTVKSGVGGTMKITREAPVPLEYAEDGETPVSFETLQLGIVLKMTPWLKDGKIFYSGVLRLGTCLGPLKNSGKGVTFNQTKTYFHDIVASGESAVFDAMTPDGKSVKLTITVEAQGSDGKATGK